MTTFVPVSNNTEVGKQNLVLDESTDLESEESSRYGTPNSSRVEPDETGDFFATFACCGFGATRGTCPLCHQQIGMSDAFCDLQGPDGTGGGEILGHMECFHREQQRKACNAVKIQALARGGVARDQLRIEAAAREAAARRALEAEREAQKAAELAEWEAAREHQAPKKKSLAKKLFGGCFGSKKQVEEQAPKVTFEDDDSYSY